MGDNRFEAEVRALVDEPFKTRILAEGGTLGVNDPYQDAYYKPKTGDWDPETITLRVRKNPKRSTVDILFSKVQYVEHHGVRVKRSLYPEGKIKLFSGSETTAKNLLDDCGFEPWFEVKKPYSAVGTLRGIEFALEQIDGLGWTLEIEGDGTDPETAALDLLRKIKTLGIREDHILSTSLPKAYAVKKGLA